MLAAIAQGVRIRPIRLLAAYLEIEEEKRFAQAYIAEQLWGINYVLHHSQFDYPHLSEMLEGSDKKEKQKADDDKTRKEVFEWLMGGEE